jgi:hypothetical protein
MERSHRTFPWSNFIVRPIRLALAAFTLAFLAPLSLHAAWWLSQEHAPSWDKANWASADLLPPASAKPEALVHIYAARVGRWRGIFAHHSWIVVKERGAATYTRFDVVGWGRPLRTNLRDADGRWFGNIPERVAAIEGPRAEALIAKIRAAVARYPHAADGDYSAWPGPNSNSFVAYVLAAIPEAEIALPPTAIGKDFRDDGWFAGLTPSATGLQLSVFGLAGVSLGWVEGVEVNVLGLVAGVDIRRPALKLPGFGRLGFDAAL